MNRRKKDIIILTVLVPVLFIVLFSGWNKKGKKNILMDEPETVQNENSNSGIPANNTEIINIFNEQNTREKEYLEKGFSRNPFAPFEMETKEENRTVTINVSGIFDDGSSGANTHAIINGRIVSKGESYKGFIIDVIRNDEVVMKRGEQVYKIKVGIPVKIEIP